MDYDTQNIFAKILRGEIPCQKVFEDDCVLAFRDINPKAPIHVLVIPKGSYRDYPSFCLKAPQMLVAQFFARVAQIAQDLQLDEGYRLIINTGDHGGQEVAHFHAHILGGSHVGPMVCPHKQQ
ncbi:MAG: histidine triad nucleotide-binding protein [Alphaproteobacteria bacterium]